MDPVRPKQLSRNTLAEVAPEGVSTLRVRTQAALFGVGYWDVLLDGRKVGGVETGGISEFLIPSGFHFVQLRWAGRKGIYNIKTSTVRLSLQADETVELRSGVRAAALIGYLALMIYFICLSLFAMNHIVVGTAFGLLYFLLYALVTFRPGAARYLKRCR